MDKQYSYPLDFSWSTEEISSVLSFLNRVEEAYEKGVEGQERQIDRYFEEASGYSSYRVVKAAQEKQKGMIRFGN